MQTYDLLAFSSSVSFAHALAQITFRKPAFRPIAGAILSQTFSMRGVGPGACIFEPSKGPLPFDLVGDALDPKRTGLLLFENIMLTYPTRSKVNVLEDFNLEVKIDDKVAIVTAFLKHRNLSCL